jgi:hypothetical protein
MSIPILCPGCKKSLNVPDHFGGKKGKCPKCSMVIEVPSPSIMEEPFDAPLPAPRANKQANHIVLFLCLGLGIVGLVLILGVLAIAGYLWGSKGQQQDVVLAQSTKSVEEKRETKNPALKGNADENKPALDTRHLKDQTDLEKAARKRLEEERKRIDEGIHDAISLRAPPLEKGKYADTGDFGKMMRDLAENEFKFREAKTHIYVSSFNQWSVESVPILDRFYGRNVVIPPGQYDFDAGQYYLDLVYWKAVYGERRGETFIHPYTQDICSLQATFKLDAKTAQRWREAIDKGVFSVVVWYRFVKAERGTWTQNSHFDPVPMLAHDITFKIDVIRFEASFTEMPPLTKVDPNATK